MSLQIYTDGACKGNPGVGGWGVWIRHSDGTSQGHCGGEAHTTNNRMELMAAIKALEITDASASITLWTDSSYVQQGISSWVKGWKAKGWRKADGKPVLNSDLWQQLDRLSHGRNISWQWVKGHAGIEGNEQADQLANQGCMEVSMQNPMGKPEPQPLGQQDSTPSSKSDWLHYDPLGLDVEATMQDNEGEDLAEQSDFLADPEESIDPPPTNSDGINSLHIVKPSQLGHGKRQLILDTETTGLGSDDRVIEIGIIEMVGRQLTGGLFHVYLNPQKPVADSERIHGLSDVFLADKPLFADIAEQLLAFVQNDEIVAHNSDFDMRFLDAELARLHEPALTSLCPVVDSLEIAKQKHPAQKNNLDALVKRYEIPERNRTYHGALLDAQILADVYLRLTGGQTLLHIDDSQNTSGKSFNHHPIQLSKRPVVQVADASDEQAHADWLAKQRNPSAFIYNKSNSPAV